MTAADTIDGMLTATLTPDGPDAYTAPPADPAPDAEQAPYGRTKDGRVRGKPGPKPKAATRRSTGGLTPPPQRTKTPGPPRRPPARSSGRTGRDYTVAVRGLVQAVAGPLAVIGQRDPAYLADAAALVLSVEPLAEAVTATAGEHPGFAAVMDRIAQVGPYAALVSVMAGLAGQLALNHGILPPAMAPVVGAVPPPMLIEAAFGQQQPDQ